MSDADGDREDSIFPSELATGRVVSTSRLATGAHFECHIYKQNLA